MITHFSEAVATRVKNERATHSTAVAEMQIAQQTQRSILTQKSNLLAATSTKHHLQLDQLKTTESAIKQADLETKECYLKVTELESILDSKVSQLEDALKPKPVPNKEMLESYKSLLSYSVSSPSGIAN